MNLFKKLLLLMFMISSSITVAEVPSNDFKKSIDDLINDVNEYNELNSIIVNEINKTGTITYSTAKNAIVKIDKINTELNLKKLFREEKNEVLVSNLKKQFKKNTKVALVIGISDYRESSKFQKLLYSVEDARIIAKTLRELGYKVQLLLNQRATKQSIINFIDSVKAETIILYYSGHGISKNDKNYLVTYDTQADSIIETGLLFSKLITKLNKSYTNKYLFIDDKSSGFSYSIVKDSKLDSSLNTKILFSAEPGEQSFLASDLRHGVFTYFLNKALKGNSADSSGLITFNRVSLYVEITVQKWAYNNIMSVQSPYSFMSTKASFPSILGFNE